MSGLCLSDSGVWLWSGIDVLISISLVSTFMCPSYTRVVVLQWPYLELVSVFCFLCTTVLLPRQRGYCFLLVVRLCAL